MSSLGHNRVAPVTYKWVFGWEICFCKGWVSIEVNLYMGFSLVDGRISTCQCGGSGFLVIGDVHV